VDEAAELTEEQARAARSREYQDMVIYQTLLVKNVSLTFILQCV
jgi:hypothetical protein